MCSVESTNNNLDYAVGAGAGYATYSVSNKLLRKPYGTYMQKAIKNAGTDNDIYKNAIASAFEKSNLKSKNIKIVHLDKYNLAPEANSIIKSIHSPIKYLENKQKKQIGTKLIAIANGRNAAFCGFNSNIYINTDKLSMSAFHEMGHAINKTSKGLKNYLYKLKQSTKLLAIPILAIALLRKPKSAKTEEEQNKSSKILDFIKEHCGALTTLALLPTVIEEGVASLNAKKLIKDILPKENIKAVRNLNKKAWLSYVIGAAVAGIAVSAASYVRDKIANNNTTQHT